jgi:hypothetical protein
MPMLRIAFGSAGILCRILRVFFHVVHHRVRNNPRQSPYDQRAFPGRAKNGQCSHKSNSQSGDLIFHPSIRGKEAYRLK